jgi:hypothetical protein
VKFLSKASLPDITFRVDGKPIRALGLASFRTEPRGMGIGRHSLKAMEDIATKQGMFMVCFCLDDVLHFYLRCGWQKIGQGPTKNFLCSIPITGKVEPPEEF